jgi:hypothetical protein
MKTVAEKMGIKPGMRAILVQAPEGVAQTIRLPGLDLAPTMAEDFDYIHFFARSRADLREHFPGLKSHLRPTGMLWVSWPKAGQGGTDLSLPAVIGIGYDHGLVESKTLGINRVWAAMKFTFPKAGKTYHNSYGTLKKDLPQ